MNKTISAVKKTPVIDYNMYLDAVKNRSMMRMLHKIHTVNQIHRDNKHIVKRTPKENILTQSRHSSKNTVSYTDVDSVKLYADVRDGSAHLSSEDLQSQLYCFLGRKKYLNCCAYSTQNENTYESTEHFGKGVVFVTLYFK